MLDEPHRLARATYLQLLGVADEDIAADYALTTIGLQPAFPLLAARFQKDNVFRDNWKGTLSLGSAKCVHVSLSFAPSPAQVAQAPAFSLSLLQTRNDAGDAGRDREGVRERGRIREAAHVANGRGLGSDPGEPACPVRPPASARNTMQFRDEARRIVCIHRKSSQIASLGEPCVQHEC